MANFNPAAYLRQQQKIWNAQATVEMQKRIEADGPQPPVLTQYDKNGQLFPQTTCSNELYPAKLPLTGK